MRGPRALAGITFAAAALAAGATSAQVPYQIGDNHGAVTVDVGVLESLGPTPTVPEMLRPGTPVGEFGYDPRIGALAAIGSATGAASYRGAGQPVLGVDPAPAPGWLRRPDAPRYAPLPETLSRGAPAPQASVPAPVLKAPASAAPTRAEPTRAAPPQASAPRVTAPRTTTPSVPAAAAPSAPPPPKPQAPSQTATVAPPAVKAPEPPPPPKVPAAIAPVPAPARSEPAKAEPPKPKAEPSNQVAAVTPAPAPSTPAPAPSSQSAAGTDVLRVPFDAGQSSLPDSAKSGLDGLIARLKKDETLRIQLLAYADGDDDNANKARRLSLSRALAVRAYLIDKQVQSTRMDVRALGNRAKDSPKDRVDVVLVGR